MIMRRYDDVHIPYSIFQMFKTFIFSKIVFKHLPNGIIHRSCFSFSTLCPYTLVLHNVHMSWTPMLAHEH